MKRKAKPLPPQDRLQEVLEYDESTGILTWSKLNKLNPYRGKVAGYIHPEYKRHRVKIDQKEYHTARVIWMLVYGEDPGEDVIDHIDRDSSNNKLNNLRRTTQKQNRLNTTKHKGWCYRPSKNKAPYQALMMIEGEQHVLGYFHTPHDAQCRYIQQHIKLYGVDSPYHPEFAGVLE